MLIDKGKKFYLLHGILESEIFDSLKSKGVKQVVIMESRPSLKASCHNARKLLKGGIEPIVISDNMAGFLFFRKHIKEVWLAYQEKGGPGAVCEIGALIRVVVAQEHGVPVKYFPAGENVKSMAKEQEVFQFMGKCVAPKGIKGYVPLLELVPKKYIKEI